MAGLDHVLKWLTAAASNTNIANIGIQGTNLVSNFDNAFREAMAEVAGGLVVRQVDKAAGTYTPVLTDYNQFWRCTGAVTLTLTAAVTLTSGWCLWVRANGGAVTIDPSGAELIDGAATLVIPDGASCLIICNGTAFFTEFNTGALTPAFALKADGRLTLTTAVPVTTSDVLTAGTIYYTPYIGNVISLYSGTGWVNRTFSEISLALTATSGKPYDVFVYDNAGVAALETLVWTDDTNRATALVRQDGVLCKTGALTRRYVGTFYASAANQTEDSLVKRYVWNMYNRVRRGCRAPLETADNWTYSTGTIRQARANAQNQFNIVRGLDEDIVDATLVVTVSSNTVGSLLYAGIGLDVTNAFAADSNPGNHRCPVANTYGEITAFYTGQPGVGRHFLTWLEVGDGTGVGTWRGDDGTPLLLQSGMRGSVFA